MRLFHKANDAERRALDDKFLAQDRAKDAEERLAKVEELKCFRAAIRNMPFGRMGSPLYAMQVTFDPEMIRYGMWSTAKPYDPYDMERYVRLLVEEMSHKLRHEILKVLTDNANTKGGVNI